MMRQSPSASGGPGGGGRRLFRALTLCTPFHWRVPCSMSEIWGISLERAVGFLNRASLAGKLGRENLFPQCCLCPGDFCKGRVSAPHHKAVEMGGPRKHGLV